MRIRQHNQKQVTVFEVNGRLDNRSVDELTQILQTAVAEGNHKMVMDMTGVEYLNSATLHTLAETLTANRANGGDLRLVGMNPLVKRVFKIVGLDRHVSTFDQLDSALASF